MSQALAPAAEIPQKRKVSPLVLAAVAPLAAGAGAVAAACAQSAADPSAEEAAAPPAPPSKPGTVVLEPFVVNVSEAPGVPDGVHRGERYLRAVIRIALDRAEAAEAASAEGLANTRLRDRILLVLSGKGADELRRYDGREKLRGELLEAVQPLFEDARVLGVYFAEFLVQ
jgi:flagellar basal body-associated protein FliL